MGWFVYIQNLVGVEAVENVYVELPRLQPQSITKTDTNTGNEVLFTQVVRL